jgi:hypothetical protein
MPFFYIGCDSYDNDNYRGLVGSGKATGVQVVSGLIIITYENGHVKRYDAKTGNYKGSM